jgi:hypothetical protein
MTSEVHMTKRILVVEDQEDNRAILRDLPAYHKFEMLIGCWGVTMTLVEGVGQKKPNRPILVEQYGPVRHQPGRYIFDVHSIWIECYQRTAGSILNIISSLYNKVSLVSSQCAHRHDQRAGSRIN